MPGQCYSCGTEFSVFKKEHGCKNCGYSVCNKCLHSKSIPVPKRNNAKHHVCNKCYRILTGQVKPQAETQYDLPQAYIKRMAALKERENDQDSQSNAMGGGGGGQGIPAHLRNLDKPDREIAARLERLKESNKPKEKVTNADITARLANLQGVPHQPQQKPSYQPPDRRLQGQQVDDLLDEIAAEIEIDSQTDPTRDVQTRLDSLRNVTDNQDKGLMKEPYENNLNKDTHLFDRGKEEMYTKNIGNVAEESQSHGDVNMQEIQRLMEQVALETQLDAQRAVQGMQKDNALMERLKQLQTKKQERQSSSNEAAASAGASSNIDDFANNSFDDNDSDGNEDEAARRIIQRYLEEAKIDDNVTHAGVDKESLNQKKLSQKDKSGMDQDDDDDGYDDSDELPYCSLCTEDAVIRCRDCDMDLYCQRCFRQCHQEMEICDHRTTLYKAPKGYH